MAVPTRSPAAATKSDSNSPAGKYCCAVLDCFAAVMTCRLNSVTYGLSQLLFSTNCQ